MPGVDAQVIFGVTGDADDLAGVSTNMVTVDVVAAEVLNTVTLTVLGELMRTVRSGQEVVTIEVQLVTEYLGANKPQQTALRLQAVGTNNVEASAEVTVIVPTGESTTTELILTLGAARQTTVSFVVVEGLQTETSLFSPEVRVDLVPEAVSLAISATPRLSEALEPRGVAVAEFRVRVDVQGSDALPFAGPIGLVLGTAVSAVADGDASHLDLSFEPLARTTAVGIYESTLTVTIAAGQVSTASVQITVEAVGLAGVATLVQLARPLILDRLELSLMDNELLQAGAGASVLATATVLAYDQFDGSFMPTGLRLRVVDVADETEVLLTPALVFDAQGEAESVLELTPPRGINQDLRVELVGVTDAEVSTNAATLELIAVELLGSLTVTGPSSTQTQTMPAEVLRFVLAVAAAGTQETKRWQPTETLELTYTAAPGVIVDYDSTLMFNTGVAKVVVSVTPVPGVDAQVIFGVTGDADDLAGVSTNMVTVDVVAAEVLNTVTLTVLGELMRTVRSGGELITIEVQLVTEYLGENKPEQTVLRLQAVATNNVEASAEVEVIVPTDESTTTALILTLGATARQSTVSFVVVEGLQDETSLFSPEVRVDLVPEAVSLTLSATPQARLELEPRGAAVAEFRVRVDVQGSDALPFAGPIDLVRGTTVSAVADGDASHLDLSFEPLVETAVGVHESILTVTLSAGQVSTASVQITVESAGLAGVSTLVQLARPLILDRLELSLAATQLRQAEAGAAVQTTATVMAYDQFDGSFSPADLRLRVVDVADETEVLVTPLVFDVQGVAQSVLELTPPRGRNQNLRVELVGVTDAEVSTNAVTLELMAVELLGSLTVTGPAVLQPQTGPGEEVLFDVRVAAAGTQETQRWQPTETLELTTTAASGVIVDYDSTLMFTAGVATVTVSVTPVPGVDAQVIFGVTGDADDLAGVSTNMVTVDVGAIEVLNTVMLTVLGELMRTVRSGQDVVTIEVQLVTEYLGDNKPEQTALRLQAVGTNNVEASAEVTVIVPTGESTTTELILTLGAARQTTVSFVVVEGLQAETSLFSPEVRVDLVPVAVSLMISALPQARLELQPRGAAVAEFRVRVDVQGSDGELFAGPIDLVRAAAVTAVENGNAGDITLSFEPLAGTATVGVYESLLTVTLSAGQVSTASVEITVTGAGLAGVSTLVQLARPLILDRLELSLAATQLGQAEAGAAVLATATVTAYDQFDGAFSPAGLRLRVVDIADETEVLLTVPALVFDTQGVAQSVLELTPPRGINQDLRVELVEVTDAEVRTSTAALSLIAVELLGSLTVTGPSSTQTQTMPAEVLSFVVAVAAVGTKETPWEPMEMLQLTTTAAPGVIVDYDSTLMFNTGVAKVVVSVTPVPGVNAQVIFGVTGDADDLAGVSTNMVTVDVVAADVLNTVTLTVLGELMRTVRSGQDEIPITVRLVTEYLGDNKPEQTVLRLQAVGTNNVEASAEVAVIAPTGESTTTELILTLGDARQTTVSFVVVEGLQAETSLFSPEVRVELVPEAVSLAVSAMPQARLELEPRGAAVAEFRVRVDVQGSDALPFAGPIDLVRGTTVSAVADGDASHLDLSFEPLVETAVGVHESTLTVTLSAGQVSTASVQITVESAGLAGVSTLVQLARPLILDRLELSLAATQLPQAEAGAAVQTTATVMAYDQFDGSFSPADLRLRVVDVADETEVLVTPLVFDVQGVAQSVLELTPPRGRNQNLRVELVGVTDAEVSTNAVTLELIAVEVLGSLMVTGPSSTLTQTMPAEAVRFELTVTAEGTKETQPWQPTEMLELTYTAAQGVIVDYDSALMFGAAGVATVAVSVTPSPGTNALVTFRVAGEPTELDGVVTNMVTVNVGVVEVLNTVTLTVQGERMRTVRSGQEEVAIEVRLMAAYLGETEPEQTRLRLRAVATNGVDASEPADVIVPAGGSTTTVLTLTLGTTARQTTVSFEVVGLPSGASLISPEVRVELVPVPVSLAISALPQTRLDLEPRRVAVAEFRVRVDVQGSDDQLFGGVSDLVFGATVTAVAEADGEKSDIDLSFEPLVETAVGVHESTVRVTIVAGQVSTASVEITVTGAGLAGVSTLVQLARPLILDRLELSLAATQLGQAEAGAAVLATATVTAYDQFDGAFSPAGLQLRVVDVADETEVLVTPLVFDVQGVAQSVLELTPPRGRNQNLRVELVGVTDAEVSTNAVTLELIAVELLGSLTVTGPSSTQTQTMPTEAVLFELTVTAEGTKDAPFQPDGLELEHTADDGVVVDYESALSFSAAGVATATVSVTPVPGTDALVTFDVTGASADVVTIPAELSVIAAEVLSTVTLTVLGELMRTVQSGQEEILITVQLTTEYLGENKPQQTVLQLRAMGTNGVVDSAVVAVIVPTGESTTTALVLRLGTARQSTVSFAVDNLPATANFISPEVRVELVPVAVSLAISALPQALLELEPRGEVTAEFRVSVNVWGSDGELFGDLSGLVLDTTVTAVVDGNAGDLAFLSAALEESAAGIHESTVRVTITAGQVSAASVEITVEGAGLTSVSVTVQLARPLILDRFQLSLTDSELRQAEAGAAVQTTATVSAYDQFGDFFRPAGLRLSVVDTGDGSEVLVTTPTLVFDAQGQAQSLLTLTPPRGRDQDLRVEVVGVTDAEVGTSTAALSLIAVEVLDSLTVTVPVSTQTQTMRDEAVLFELTITAEGTKGSEQFLPTETLELTTTAAPGVMVVYDESPLRFSAGVATVTVSVTPVPGTDARVTFDVTGASADVVTIPAELSVIAAEVLSRVTLTVQGERMRIVRSGQEKILITVQLQTEYLGENKPEQTALQLRALGTNGVAASAVVAVIVPTGESTTTDLVLMLGTTARQTTVSFEVVNLPAETSLLSPEVRVELVPVPVSLAISVLPEALLELERSGEVTAEFRVRVMMLRVPMGCHLAVRSICFSTPQ